MYSRWFHLKEEAVALRETGMSITVIERRLGIPRSTLSGWFKNIQLTEDQRLSLMKSKQDGWAKARIKAVESHKAQKTLRLLEAKRQAEKTLAHIDITDGAILDLAFAMLYLGEGSKNGTTSIASSDPRILRFVLAVLRKNYGVNSGMVKCELHLRADQGAEELKQYWSSVLNVPLSNFRKAYFDQRSAGRPTYDRYKGVCVLYCGSIAIQRKLTYLYNHFCDKVAILDGGD